LSNSRVGELFEIDRFTSDLPRVRVVFGDGTIAELDAELEGLEFRRLLMIRTSGRSATAATVRNAAGSRLVGEYDRAALHVPAERVVDALAAVDALRPDALLSVGGGSSLGLAKALARERHLPIVAVPTTYAGSEMTSIWGITDGDQKHTGRTPQVAPRLVVYDPLLTLSLPAAVSAASGMNAIAHAVEALYAPGAGPLAACAAEDAIRSLSEALPPIVRNPHDREARRLALRGAHSAGIALELSRMGLHHRICHVLGGTFGLPHAETHAAVLPHVVVFNAPAAPTGMRRIADALGSPEAALGLFRLNEALGVVTSLQALGLQDDDVDEAAELITASPYSNPRTATRDDVRDLLRRAM
jgi:alcohol dehydrogenase class IV